MSKQLGVRWYAGTLGTLVCWYAGTLVDRNRHEDDPGEVQELSGHLLQKETPAKVPIISFNLPN